MAALPEKDALNKVFVGNLSFFCTRENLEGLFSPFGSIESVHLCKSKDGEPLYYGFVHFYDPTDAQKAILALNNAYFAGRLLRVYHGHSTRAASSQPEGVEILVSFLSYQTVITISEEVLFNVFSQFGKVLDCVVKNYSVFNESASSRASRQSGYGFLTLQSIDTAQCVIHEVKSSVIPLFTNTFGEPAYDISDIQSPVVMLDCKLSRNASSRLHTLLARPRANRPETAAAAPPPDLSPPVNNAFTPSMAPTSAVSNFNQFIGHPIVQVQNNQSQPAMQYSNVPPQIYHPPLYSQHHHQVSSVSTPLLFTQQSAAPPEQLYYPSSTPYASAGYPSSYYPAVHNAPLVQYIPSADPALPKPPSPMNNASYPNMMAFTTQTIPTAQSVLQQSQPSSHAMMPSMHHPMYNNNNNRYTPHHQHPSSSITNPALYSLPQLVPVSGLPSPQLSPPPNLEIRHHHHPQPQPQPHPQQFSSSPSPSLSSVTAPSSSLQHPMLPPPVYSATTNNHNLTDTNHSDSSTSSKSRQNPNQTLYNPHYYRR